jgi:ribose 5-phosphate isomerase B
LETVDAKVLLAGDHHAEPMLVRIRSYFKRHDIPFAEYGYRGGENPQAKLVDFIPQLTAAVKADPDASGILVCGTGTGVEIGANRFAGIRAALCASPQAAEWARVYDDANILCLAAWALDQIDLEAILEKWFASAYDGSVARRGMLNTFDRWAA